MEIRLGSIVRSLTGHDKDRFYAVLGLDAGSCVIADGKVRRVEKPKRKNLKHVAATGGTVSVEPLPTNRELRRALFPYNYGDGRPAD